MTEQEIKKILETPEELAEIYKALSHPVRLKVLGLLLEKEHNLGELVKTTGLSKNALTNQLTTLMNTGLITRISHGKYGITEDAQTMLTSTVEEYLSSDRYRARRRQRDSLMYAWSWRELKEKTISNPAKMQPSWFSYQGAVLGVLKRIGLNVDLSDVIAVSGYGWITNAMKRHLCPSAPSAYHQDNWREIYAATENLGYKMDVITSGLFEWDTQQKPTPESILNAKKQYDAVVEEIDADHPVVMWGIPIPEYGIVNGYKGEEYIVSTFRSLIGQPDTPIHYTGLMAPGGLMIMRFIEPKKVDPKQVAIQTLKRGYKLGTGDVPQIDEYVLGPDAYDVLEKNLTMEPFDENSHHGTAYTMACLMEAKLGVSEYLKKVNPLLDADLLSTAKKYHELNQILQRCHEAFPLGPGEMQKKKCDKVADWLGEAKEIEVEALTGVKEIIDAL